MWWVKTTAKVLGDIEVGWFGGFSTRAKAEDCVIACARHGDVDVATIVFLGEDREPWK